MRRFILGLAATAAIAAPLALGSAANAYTAPAGQEGRYVGESVVLPGGTTSTIKEVDLNVQLGDSGFYHEYDLTFGTPHGGVIDFRGVGMQSDNDGEMITGA